MSKNMFMQNNEPKKIELNFFLEDAYAYESVYNDQNGLQFHREKLERSIYKLQYNNSSYRNKQRL